jgi:hypothetical protein
MSMKIQVKKTASGYESPSLPGKAFASMDKLVEGMLAKTASDIKSEAGMTEPQRAAWISKKCKFAQVDVWEGVGGKQQTPASQAAGTALQQAPAAQPAAVSPQATVEQVLAKIKSSMAEDPTLTPDAAIQAAIQIYPPERQAPFAQHLKKLLGQP